MSKEVIGFMLIIGLLTSVVTFGRRPTETVAGATPAKQLTPKLYGIRDELEADNVYDVIPHKTATGAALDHYTVFERNGLLYAPAGADYDVTSRAQLPIADFRLDGGAFTGYRAAGRGNDADEFTVGVRLSPGRFLYGTVSPDLVIGRDWAGGGVSIYAPRTLVDPRWSRVGVGAWYGYPFGSPSRSGGPGWTVGIALSIQ